MKTNTKKTTTKKAATTKNERAKFSRQNQPVACRVCGKKTTWSEANGEGGGDICKKCWDAAGLENEHMDGHHKTPVAGCKDCEAEAPATPFDEAAKPAKKATKKPAAKTAKPAKKAAKAKAAKPAAKTTKAALVLDMITRKGGATATELQEATGWQAHSVRGFLSTAAKKGLAQVTSTKREDGQRVYSA